MILVDPCVILIILPVLIIIIIPIVILIIVLVLVLTALADIEVGSYHSALCRYWGTPHRNASG